tara:strand:- start:6350 stop:6727 length:378 start_codon:yes stop_codon:yes gene_type:complete
MINKPRIVFSMSKFVLITTTICLISNLSVAQQIAGERPQSAPSRYVRSFEAPEAPVVGIESGRRSDLRGVSPASNSFRAQLEGLQAVMLQAVENGDPRGVLRVQSRVTAFFAGRSEAELIAYINQ